MNGTCTRPPQSRRRFLAGLAGAAIAPLLASRGSSHAAEDGKVVDAKLLAAPATAQLAPEKYPSTAVWAYNASVPGPVLRVRQGERLRVAVENQLAEGTTVHWHGVRVPNAMDGVPIITQPSIDPGGRFVYEFAPPDAGTFFYHPHQRGFEQMGRGLAGALIVEERDSPEVDRELVWMLGDFRLNADASIRGGFGSFMDVSHAGRIGNTVTINGRLRGAVQVRAGERIRLRLIAATSARIFALDFQGHAPWIVALDGQPVAPHRPEGGAVVLAPAQRIDLIIDMTGAPGSRHEVRDGFYRRLPYQLVELAYADEAPLRARPADPPVLPPNPLADPDLASAERHDVVFTGGMMGTMRGLRKGMAWAVNGASNGCGEGASAFDPLFVMRLGRSYVLNLVNDTAWHHPIHLHGMSFRVISRNGNANPRREWLDTVLLAPRETAEIAFVADNPGDWMFHCHVLEHQAAGMMSCIRVI